MFTQKNGFHDDRTHNSFTEVNFKSADLEVTQPRVIPWESIKHRLSVINMDPTNGGIKSAKLHFFLDCMPVQIVHVDRIGNQSILILDSYKGRLRVTGCSMNQILKSVGLQPAASPKQRIKDLLDAIRKRRFSE